jgi:hypothetical protein
MGSCNDLGALGRGKYMGDDTAITSGWLSLAILAINQHDEIVICSTDKFRLAIYRYLMVEISDLVRS